MLRLVETAGGIKYTKTQILQRVWATYGLTGFVLETQMAYCTCLILSCENTGDW